jgi:hypothetical protein
VTLTAYVRYSAGSLLIATFETINEADAGTRTPDPIITSNDLQEASYGLVAANAARRKPRVSGG